MYEIIGLYGLMVHYFYSMKILRKNNFTSAYKTQYWIDYNS